MIDIHFEKPHLDIRYTPQQNLQILDRWSEDLVNNLSLMIQEINKEIDDGK